MKKPTAIEGAFETPAQMIDAIRARRGREAQAEADEERLTEDAVAIDPEVQACMQAALAEDAAAEHHTMAVTLYGQQKPPAA